MSNEVKRWWLRQSTARKWNILDVTARKEYSREGDVEVMRVEDHERIVAELKAEYEQLQAVVTAPQMQYEEEIAELRAEVERLKIDNDRHRNGKANLQFDLTTATETIASQKRVIDAAKELVEFINKDGPAMINWERVTYLCAVIEKGEA